tara:strand:- start:786 stop:1481 length:696 start_codon:yes stop_codon:yes gene_type:complete
MALKSTTTSSTYANSARAKDSQVEGGTVAHGGDIDATSGPIKNQIKLDAMRSDTQDETVGAKMVELDGTTGSTTDRVGVAKAYSEGTFAYNSTENVTNGTTWVVQGGNVTQKLSGVSTDVLRQGANGAGLPEGTERIKIDTRRLSNPHASGGMDVLAIPSTEITPGFTKGVTAGNVTTFINPVDGTAAVASEIKSTRAIPGELVYHFGGAGGPQTDDYKSKEVYESLDGSS